MKEKKKPEYILYGPKDEEGKQDCIRQVNGQLVVGEMRPFNGFDGQPAGTEVIRVERIAPSLGIITESYKAGPAMVNSDSYRTGWDNIFGTKKVGQA